MMQENKIEPCAVEDKLSMLRKLRSAALASMKSGTSINPQNETVSQESYNIATAVKNQESEEGSLNKSCFRYVNIPVKGIPSDNMNQAINAQEEGEISEGEVSEDEASQGEVSEGEISESESEIRSKKRPRISIKDAKKYFRKKLSANSRNQPASKSPVYRRGSHHMSVNLSIESDLNKIHEMKNLQIVDSNPKIIILSDEPGEVLNTSGCSSENHITKGNITMHNDINTLYQKRKPPVDFDKSNISPTLNQENHEEPPKAINSESYTTDSSESYGKKADDPKTNPEYQMQNIDYNVWLEEGTFFKNVKLEDYLEISSDSSESAVDMDTGSDSESDCIPDAAADSPAKTHTASNLILTKGNQEKHAMQMPSSLSKPVLFFDVSDSENHFHSFTDKSNAQIASDTPSIPLGHKFDFIDECHNILAKSMPNLRLMADQLLQNSNNQQSSYENHLIDQDTLIMNEKLVPGCLDDNILKRNLGYHLKTKEKKIAELKKEYEKRLRQIESKSNVSPSPSGSNLLSELVVSVNNGLENPSSQKPLPTQQVGLGIQNSLLDLSPKNSQQKHKPTQQSQLHNIVQSASGLDVANMGSTENHTDSKNQLSLDLGSGVDTQDDASKYREILMKVTKKKFTTKLQIATLNKQLEEIEMEIAEALSRLDSAKNKVSSISPATHKNLPKLKQYSHNYHVALATEKKLETKSEPKVSRDIHTSKEIKNPELHKEEEASKESEQQVLSSVPIMGFIQFVLDMLKSPDTDIKVEPTDPSKNINAFLQRGFVLDDALVYNPENSMLKSTDLFDPEYDLAQESSRNKPVFEVNHTGPYSSYTTPIPSTLRNFLIGKPILSNDTSTRAGDGSKKLCTFESSGGFCNDDDCRSSHFIDFKNTPTDSLIYFLLQNPSFNRKDSEIEYYESLALALKPVFTLEAKPTVAIILDFVLSHLSTFYRDHPGGGIQRIGFLSSCSISSSAVGSSIKIDNTADIYHNIKNLLKYRLQNHSDSISNECCYWKSILIYKKENDTLSENPKTEPQTWKVPIINQALKLAINKSIIENYSSKYSSKPISEISFTRYWEVGNDILQVKAEDEDHATDSSAQKGIDFLIREMNKTHTYNLDELLSLDLEGRIYIHFSKLYTNFAEKDIEFINLFLEILLHSNYGMGLFESIYLSVDPSKYHNAESETLHLLFLSKRYLETEKELLQFDKIFGCEPLISLLNDLCKSASKLISANCAEHFKTINIIILLWQLHWSFANYLTSKHSLTAEFNSNFQHPFYEHEHFSYLFVWMQKTASIKSEQSLIKHIGLSPSNDMFSYFTESEKMKLLRLRSAEIDVNRNISTDIRSMALHDAFENIKPFSSPKLKAEPIIPNQTSLAADTGLSEFLPSFGFDVFSKEADFSKLIRPSLCAKYQKSTKTTGTNLCNLNIYDWYFLWQLFVISFINGQFLLKGSSMNTLGFVNELSALDTNHQELFIIRIENMNSEVRRWLEIAKEYLVALAYAFTENPHLKFFVSSLDISLNYELFNSLEDIPSFPVTTKKYSLFSLPKNLKRVLKLYFLSPQSTIHNVLHTAYSEFKGGKPIEDFESTLSVLSNLTAITYFKDFGVINMYCKIFSTPDNPTTCIRFFFTFLKLFSTLNPSHLSIVEPVTTKAVFSKFYNNLVKRFDDQRLHISPKDICWFGKSQNDYTPEDVNLLCLNTILDGMGLSRQNDMSIVLLDTGLTESMMCYRRSPSLWLSLSYFEISHVRKLGNGNISNHMKNFYELCFTCFQEMALEDQDIQDYSFSVLWSEYLFYESTVLDNALPKNRVKELLEFYKFGSYVLTNTAVFKALVKLPTKNNEKWLYSQLYISTLLSLEHVPSNSIARMLLEWCSTGVRHLIDTTKDVSTSLPQIRFIKKVFESTVIPICNQFNGMEKINSTYDDLCRLSSTTTRYWKISEI